MTDSTALDHLVLHVLRTMGYGTCVRIAERLGAGEVDVLEHLLDAQAYGWVAHGVTDRVWSLTEVGKRIDEENLRIELERTDARGLVEDVHRMFGPVNARVTTACTAWQLTEMGMATSPITVDSVLNDLQEAANSLEDFEEHLTNKLVRFSGYHRRFHDALTFARDDARWINGIDRNSCHTVWFEFHEDLLATLGLTRGTGV